MKQIFTFFFLGLMATASAKSGSLSGSIQDEKGEAVGYATVVLNSGDDSTMVKAALTDDNGAYRLPNLAEGDYYLVISFLGYENLTSPVFSLKAGENKKMNTLVLKETSKELTEVTVTAQRPILEVHPDKTVFNVDGSINSTGSDAFELLRKSPGVLVDNNDNIILAGKDGVVVYIDGKPSPLSRDDLVAFLKTVQSSEIDAIEIITNPSAKYDAAGNAGIINIKLKKDKKLGTNVNLNVGAAMGITPKYSGSISINHRNKKVNYFGSYGTFRGANQNDLNFYRRQLGTYYDQRSVNTNNSFSNNFKAGMDYSINKKHTLGVLVNGFVTNSSSTNNTRTVIGPESSELVNSVLIAANKSDQSRLSYNANINYQFDNKVNVLNVDFDYGSYQYRATSYQPNFYKDPTEQVTQLERIFSSDTPINIDIYSIKTDYEQPLGKGKMGLGIKSSYVKTDNTFDFFNILNGQEVIDSERSNNFVFTENINAAYANYQIQIKKWGISAGLRVENTNSLGELTSMQSNNDDEVKRNYVDFFPSGGLTYQVNQTNSFRLNYSRRIDRPSYQDLNPFEYRLDELTYRKGNAFLKPQYTHNIQLTHTFNYSLNTTLGYSITNDFFTEITDTTEFSRSFIINRNLATQKVLSLNISAPFPVTKWWSVYANANANYKEVDADLGEGKEIAVKIFSYNFYAQNTFKLPWKVSMEVSGFYSGPGLWGGTFASDAMWGVDLGFQRKILNNRGNIKISLTDVFNTKRWRGVTDFGGLYMDANGGWESRQLRVNFSYLFGNDQVAQTRRRKTGLEDEKDRIKGD